MCINSSGLFALVTILLATIISTLHEQCTGVITVQWHMLTTTTVVRF